MSGVPNVRTDATYPEPGRAPLYPVIPWTLGFAPLLIVGILVRFRDFRVNKDQPS